jgi:hypothetical protein
MAHAKVPGMRAQTFHVSYVRFDMSNCESSCVFHYATCMERVRAHPQHLICAGQLASYKRDLTQCTQK